MARLIKNLNMTTSTLSLFHLRNIFKENVMQYNNVRCGCIQIMSLHNIARPATRKYKPWDKQELDMLKNAVNKHGRNWKYISEEHFKLKRDNIALCRKWKHLELIKSKPPYHNIWTEGDDKILMNGIEKYGVGNPTPLVKLFPNKIPDQVRSKWREFSQKNHGKWTKEEDDKLFDLVNQYGRKWAMISDLMNKPYYICWCRYMYFTYKTWTSEEKEKFGKAIKKYDGNWDKIKEEFPDRNMSELKSFYRRNSKLHLGVNTGKWNEEEIRMFLEAFEKHGKRWSLVSQYIGTRTSMQCQDFYQYRRGNNLDNLIQKYRSSN